MKTWVMTEELRRELLEDVIAEDGWEVAYRREQVERVLAVEIGSAIMVPSNEEWAEAEAQSLLEARWPVWSLVDYFGVEHYARLVEAGDVQDVTAPIGDTHGGIVTPLMTKVAEDRS